MARGTFVKLLAAVILIAAEMAAVTALLVVAPAPAGAQLFDDRFPFFGRNSRRGWFDPPEREERAAPPDYSKAPAPKKTDAVPQTSIMVFGDSMADWLAYGLEQAFADTPEIGVLRRHRTSSGLIRTEVKSDPRGEYPDWPQAAKEMIAAQKPKFVLMMIGLNDRQADQGNGAGRCARSRRPRPLRTPTPLRRNSTRPLLLLLSCSRTSPSCGHRGGGPRIGGIHQDLRIPHRCLERGLYPADRRHHRRAQDGRGADLLGRACRRCGAGAPAADIPFLNDLYRSRADKAGIVYIDVWDGFVDEDGRFAQSGPDFEGQTRRLRAGDGVHFTQAGARKLAHFVEREIDRWLTRAPLRWLCRSTSPKLRLPRAGAAKLPPPGSRPRRRGRWPARRCRWSPSDSGEADELLGGKPVPG